MLSLGKSGSRGVLAANDQQLAQSAAASVRELLSRISQILWYASAGKSSTKFIRLGRSEGNGSAGCGGASVACAIGHKNQKGPREARSHVSLKISFAFRKEAANRSGTGARRRP